MTHSFISALPTAPADRLTAIRAKAQELHAKPDSDFTEDDVTLTRELASAFKRADAARSLEAFTGSAGGSTSTFRDGQWTAEPLQTSHAKGVVEPRAQQAAAFTKAMSEALEKNPANLRTKAGVLPSSGTATAFSFGGPLIASPRGPLTVSDLVQRTPTDSPSGTVLVQTLRQNNAASVPVGGYKPSSNYELRPRTWHVATVAHVLVTARQYLADYANLADFLGAELAFGLALMLDAAILNGTTDEEGNAAPGLLSPATAVPSTTFTTDALTTLRASIGDLDQSGITPSAMVLNPADYQALELLKDDQGRFLLPQVPTERAPRTVWSVPVVLSNGIPSGSALVGDFGQAAVMDREQVRIEAFEQGAANEASGSGSSRVEAQDLARRNQVLIRAELRAVPVVSTPAAFRKVSLSA